MVRSDEYSACHMVLDTYELLELIMVQLRPDDVHRARLVSIAWCALFEKSAKVRLAGVIKPCAWDFAEPRCGRVELKPLSRFWKVLEPRLHTNLMTIDWDYLLAVKHHYLTFPPCSAVRLWTTWIGRREDGSGAPLIESTVYVPTGIRVEDIRGVMDTMLMQIRLLSFEPIGICMGVSVTGRVTGSQCFRHLSSCPFPRTGRCLADDGDSAVRMRPVRQSKHTDTLTVIVMIRRIIIKASSVMLSVLSKDSNVDLAVLMLHTKNLRTRRVSSLFRRLPCFQHKPSSRIKLPGLSHIATPQTSP